MRISPLAALTLALTLAGCGGSEQPTKLWEATGFKEPESAAIDPLDGVIYVSNVAGSPVDRDGNGYISKLTLDGKVTAAEWVTGLDSPKGVLLIDDRLYVADLDNLVEIDTTTGTIAARHAAPGAKILNGISADSEGRIYVSDWTGNAIWRLADGTFEKWLESDELKNPNGVLVDGDKLIVAAWGKAEADFSTKVPGNLIAVSLADKTITSLGSKPVGNLDGIVAFDSGTYVVTDWVAGKVFKVTHAGDATEYLSISQGTADLDYDAASHLAVIPVMASNKVVAYKF
ncbi:MAG: SMP-30/gluconolactonase/LRE family protein [Hyphomicrobium sp.]|uniref:SMP-30/gluconolactonase/LRE family protein n=1 Tax=Hyphomicrobium sp. TaxID=82 RepID=UPI003D097B4A